MKHLKIFLLVAVLAGGSIFYFNHSDRVSAQVSKGNNCTPSQVTSSVLNIPINPILQSAQNYPVYKFRITNSSSCVFTLKDFKIQELINYNGSVIYELQVQQNGIDLGNELVISKVGDEIKYERSIQDINNASVTIPANSSKEFTVLATDFGNTSEQGDAFSLGLQYFGGFLNSNIQVNHWHYPIKWGPILSVQ